MNISEVLLQAQSPIAAVRQNAQEQLEVLAKNNLAQYVAILCAELVRPDAVSESRRLAALMLKNAFSAQDPQLRMERAQSWLHIPPDQRQAIKQQVLTILASPDAHASSGAAQVIARLGVIELEAQEWPELISILHNNMEQGNNVVKRSTLQCLGMLCEEITPMAIAEQSSFVLAAIVAGTEKSLPEEIQRTAIVALLNSLAFVEKNMADDTQRNYIMQVICEAARSPSLAIRFAAMQCLVRVATLYYGYLNPYIFEIFNITTDAIKDVDPDDDESDAVASQAVEFWSTIADKEYDIMAENQNLPPETKPEQVCHDFTRNALNHLVPFLTNALLHQQEDADPDDYNVAMAAAVCLTMISQAVDDLVVGVVMPFVQANIVSDDWRRMEAATLAFGSILEGPEGDEIEDLIKLGLPTFDEHLKDPSITLQVKDTTAWTIGRIAKLHPKVVKENALTLLETLTMSLSLHSRVANHACWAIGGIVNCFADDYEDETSTLSACFTVIMQNLLACAFDRPDGRENNLRIAAFESINDLITVGAQDTHSIILDLVPGFLEQLEKTFQPNLDITDRNQYQAYICSILQTITMKLEGLIAPHADRMIRDFYDVFQCKNSHVYEEALGAAGAVCSALGENFAIYMENFKGYLLEGLLHYSEPDVLSAALQALSDCCRSLGKGMTPIAGDIINILLQDLQHQLPDSVKPLIILGFADVANALCGEFRVHLSTVMNVLQFASETAVDRRKEEFVEYLIQLRENIFTTYTIILEALRVGKEVHLLRPFLIQIFQFVEVAYNDNEVLTAGILKGICGVLGDIAVSFKQDPEIRDALSRPIVSQIVNSSLSCNNEKTVETAEWTCDILTKLQLFRPQANYY